MPYFQNERKDGKFRFICDHCNKEGWKPTKQLAKLRLRHSVRVFCCSQCFNERNKIQHRQVCQCISCNKSFQTSIRKDLRSKLSGKFCSQSCAAKWNNSHKTKGTRVSKLQRHIHKKLYQKYPCLPFQFNRTEAIGMQLDIYIPTIKIAFQINGVFHYKPIYGEQKLKKTQVSDANKIKLCKNNKIILYTLDVSNISYFNEEDSDNVFSLIQNQIDKVYTMNENQQQINFVQDIQSQKIYSGKIHKKTCPNCNKNFQTTRKSIKFCCKNCACLNTAKTLHGIAHRPTKEQLSKLYIEQKKSQRQISQIYNVSHVSIMKWLLKYGIK